MTSCPAPTETLVVADDTALADEVAADLLAQAEHDLLASAILITSSERLVAAVPAALDEQLGQLERRPRFARESLERRGGIVVVASVERALELANEYAPEHLCLLGADAWSHLPAIKNAGGVFLGRHSPEAAGDYVAGPSHIHAHGCYRTFLVAALRGRLPQDHERDCPLGPTAGRAWARWRHGWPAPKA